MRLVLQESKSTDGWVDLFYGNTRIATKQQRALRPECLLRIGRRRGDKARAFSYRCVPTSKSNRQL